MDRRTQHFYLTEQEMEQGLRNIFGPISFEETHNCDVVTLDSMFAFRDDAEEIEEKGKTCEHKYSD